MFGKTRRITDLAADDFEALRTNIAKMRGPFASGNEVQRICVAFKYAPDNEKLKGSDDRENADMLGILSSLLHATGRPAEAELHAPARTRELERAVSTSDWAVYRESPQGRRQTLRQQGDLKINQACALSR